MEQRELLKQHGASLPRLHVSFVKLRVYSDTYMLLCLVQVKIESKLDSDVFDVTV